MPEKVPHLENVVMHHVHVFLGRPPCLQMHGHVHKRVNSDVAVLLEYRSHGIQLLHVPHREHIETAECRFHIRPFADIAAKLVERDSAIPVFVHTLKYPLQVLEVTLVIRVHDLGLIFQGDRHHGRRHHVEDDQVRDEHEREKERPEKEANLGFVHNRAHGVRPIFVRGEGNQREHRVAKTVEQAVQCTVVAEMPLVLDHQSARHGDNEREQYEKAQRVNQPHHRRLHPNDDPFEDWVKADDPDGLEAQAQQPSAIETPTQRWSEGARDDHANVHDSKSDHNDVHRAPRPE
mmetsp:Transcript_77216/g.214714  ORF Transcript_77216/g.214714 Transcript_77216/m.214714 type:complete len:291 (+) Transcript_77216:910-1782(+)